MIKCHNCSDTEWLVVDGEAMPCKCRVGSELARTIKSAGIGDAYTKCRLDNYKTTTPSQAKGKEADAQWLVSALRALQGDL